MPLGIHLDVIFFSADNVAHLVMEEQVLHLLAISGLHFDNLHGT